MPPRLRELLRFSGRGANDTLRPGGISLAPDELMVRDGDRESDDARVGVAAAVFARLTARQRLVSVWMTAGFSDEDIARHLALTRRQLAAEFAEITQVVRHREL